MKKFLIIALLCLLAVSAAAQTPDNSVAFSNQDSLAGITAFDSYGGLLQKQNKLLQSRNTALIITAAGLGTTLSGGLLYAIDGMYQASSIAVLAGFGGTLTGGIWLLVNEFKIVENKRKVNDIILKGIPGGVALEF